MAAGEANAPYEALHEEFGWRRRVVFGRFDRVFHVEATAADGWCGGGVRTPRRIET